MGFQGGISSVYPLTYNFQSQIEGLVNGIPDPENGSRSWWEELLLGG